MKYFILLVLVLPPVLCLSQQDSGWYVEATGFNPANYYGVTMEGICIDNIKSFNCNGIPPKIMDKIFQPFFTNNPTGQGTRLGVSLAYDIVKARGGELKVDTKEGEGSEFKIILSV